MKFLTFRDALNRLNTHMLAGESLRTTTGEDNGVRLLDLNNDGYLDVVIGNPKLRATRIWHPQSRTWRDSSLPLNLVRRNASGAHVDSSVRFGIIGPEHQVAMLTTGKSAPESQQAYLFSTNGWLARNDFLRGLELNGEPVLTIANGRDRGVRLRDLDNDGQCELIVGNELQSAVFTWSAADQSWKQAPFSLPAGANIVDSSGKDAGLRFVDLNQDGYADVLFSNERRYSLHLFRPKPDNRLGWTVGWTDEIISQPRSEGELIPMIVRGGTHPNNGAWFHSGSMWVQNEQTSALPDHVDRRSFQQLLTCDQPPGLSPEKSLASIKMHPGFKVELVATEPLVQDPIAFDWGADGKLWVVEMGDYPRGIDGKGKPGGRVRFLEDTDGDGRYDKSTIFLDGLNFPNGIIPWRKGVIVSAAPEIFYAEDTDGDGKADLRKTLFAGFVAGNQQHRANGFEYGLDNWLYGANGDSGGEVYAVSALIAAARAKSSLSDGQSAGAKRLLNLRGHDFRVQPDEGRIETVAGQTQYGRHRNDWGDWFGNNNPTWLWHYYLSEEYLVRNPNLAVRNTKRMLANYPDSTHAFPASRTLQRFNDPAQANHVTSGNSPTPYRDELFGPEFANSVFISEPVHNLIHREVLERDGVSFKSHRAKEEQQSEFLASTDNWFRTGPDGALYIADMYRLVIEHPEWIPPDMQKRLDLRAGSDKGRIYRVYPEGATLRAVPHLDKLPAAQLVAALDSANGWQRDTAQRLLIQAQDAKAVTPLKKLLSAQRAQTRLQAMATLQGLNAIAAGELSKALKDSHPMVRRFALQLAEPFLRKESDGKGSALTRAVAALVNDAELAVRYQLAFTLGEWRSAEAARVLLQLADRDGANSDMVTAILSSAEPHAKTMLALLLDEKRSSDPPAILGALLTSTSVASDRTTVSKALDTIAQPRSGQFRPWQYRAFSGLLQGLERQGKALADLLNSGAGTDVEPIFASARRAATNRNESVSTRLAAVGVLGRTVSMAKNDWPILAALLAPQNPIGLQDAALEAFKQSPDQTVATILLAN